jgi:hypothetical protein
MLQIPETYYVPSCPLCLMSPQHSSQVTHDHRGTYSTNFGDHVLFVWNQEKFKIVPYQRGTVTQRSPGTITFSTFVGPSLGAVPIFFASTVIMDVEADAFESETDDDDTSLSAPDIPTHVEGEHEDRDVNIDNVSGTPGVSTQAQPDLIPFDLDHDNLATNLASPDDTVSSLDARSDLLRWHYRLGCLPFANIRLMVAKGEIPKRLATCKIPKCQSCLYGRATKHAWHSRGKMHNICTITKPGGCVSVDQLESPVPGFVGQNKGYFFLKLLIFSPADLDFS